MSCEGDALRIQKLFGKHYNVENKACVAALAEGEKKGSYFAGDAALMLDLLADMAGNAIAQMSDSQDEMSQISTIFRRGVGRAAHVYWQREHPDDEPKHVNMDAKEKLLN